MGKRVGGCHLIVMFCQYQWSQYQSEEGAVAIAE